MKEKVTIEGRTRVGKTICTKSFFNDIKFNMVCLKLFNPNDIRNENAIITGVPGAGKTVCTKSMFLDDINNTELKSLVIDDESAFVNVAEHTYNPVINLKRNPFHSITEEKKLSDIFTLIEDIVNISTKESMYVYSHIYTEDDTFFKEYEIELLKALFFYVYSILKEEEHNFDTVLKMLRLSEIDEDNQDFKSSLDSLFEKFEEEQPNHIAVQSYNRFKQLPYQVQLKKSIILSVEIKLQSFYINFISTLIEDEINISNNVVITLTNRYFDCNNKEEIDKKILEKIFEHAVENKFEKIYFSSEFYSHLLLKYWKEYSKYLFDIVVILEMQGQNIPCTRQFDKSIIDTIEKNFKYILFFEGGEGKYTVRTREYVYKEEPGILNIKQDEKELLEI